MSWSYDPSGYTTGTKPSVADFQSIAVDLHTLGGNKDAARYGFVNAAFVTLVPQELPGNSYAVTAGSWTTGTATLTVGAHNFKVNQLIVIASVVSTGPGSYNNGGKEVAVSGVTGTTVSFPLTSNPGTWTSGGSVTAWGTPTSGMIAADPSGVLNEYASGSFGPVSGAGTVTHTGALTSGALVVGNGSADITVPSSGASLDTSGKITSNALNFNQDPLTLVNGLNSNVNIGNFSYVSVSGPTGAFSLGGFTGGSRILFVWNATTQAMTIVNEDASSTAANRIQTLSGSNVTLATRMSFAVFIYASNNRWSLVSTN